MWIMMITIVDQNSLKISISLCPGFLPADSTFCAEVNEINQEIRDLLISNNTP